MYKTLWPEFTNMVYQIDKFMVKYRVAQKERNGILPVKKNIKWLVSVDGLSFPEKNDTKISYFG